MSSSIATELSKNPAVEVSSSHLRKLGILYFFWKKDHECVLFVVFVSPGTTVSNEGPRRSGGGSFKRKLKVYCPFKWPNMLEGGMTPVAPRKRASSFAVCPLFTYSICYWLTYRYFFRGNFWRREGFPWGEFSVGRIPLNSYTVFFIFISFSLDAQFYVCRECHGELSGVNFQRGRNCLTGFFRSKKVGNVHKRCPGWYLLRSRSRSWSRSYYTKCFWPFF